MFTTFLRRLFHGRPRMLDPGMQAPDFRLPDQRGRELSLADFTGKKLVLWFYPQADTPAGKAEADTFRDWMEEFDKLGVAVCGVSLDPVEENRSFAEKYHYPFPLLSDPGGEVARAYGATSAKEDQYASRCTFVVDRHGCIEHAIKVRHPHAHAEELLAMLKREESS